MNPYDVWRLPAPTLHYLMVAAAEPQFLEAAAPGRRNLWRVETQRRTKQKQNLSKRMPWGKPMGPMESWGSVWAQALVPFG